LTSSPFVSRRARSRHLCTVTVLLFCCNYRRCSCWCIQHPGVSLTFGDAFQSCSQHPLTYAKSYGKCLDHYGTSSEIIECSSETYDFCVPHHVPAEDLCDLPLEPSPIAVHLALAGLSIVGYSSRFLGFLPWEAQDYVVCHHWAD
jgi:hypothetical protein